MHRHPLAPGVLDTAQVQDLGPAGRHLEHLLVRDLGDALGAGHDARVGGEDAVDVGVDLAEVGPERGGERHGRGVGGTTAEGRDVLGVLGDALEPGHDDDVVLVERTRDAPGGDVDDPGVAVRAGGDDARLRPRQRPGVHALVGDGHGQQCGTHPLTRGQEHVELPGRRLRRHLQREVHQVVGGVPHRRDDDDDVVALLLGGDDTPGDPFDGLGIRDRRATVLLHDSHPRTFRRRTGAHVALQTLMTSAVGAHQRRPRATLRACRRSAEVRPGPSALHPAATRGLPGCRRHRSRRPSVGRRSSAPRRAQTSGR